MPSSRKFYRTVIEVEVLTEERMRLGSLGDIHYEITDGGASGKYGVTCEEVVDGPTAARLLKEQGSDPGFFQLDDDGNDVEE